MKTLFTVLLGLLMFSGYSQTKGDIPDRFDQQMESENFVLLWNEYETKDSEIEEAKIFSERVFVELSELFGKDKMPEDKLIITFSGEGVDKGTRKKSTPHVDYQGRIHLYRFDQGGYLSVLPHEMVHAIRVNSISRWDRFFEEGFASAVAYHLYPERQGFPRFGYSLDLIAGYWLKSGRGIPLTLMRDDHDRLNLKCQLQTYVAREDFFNYLAVSDGIEKLVAFSYYSKVGTLRGYEDFWNKPLSVLVKQWESDLASRYEAIENAESLIDQYFKTTSAQYIPVCEQGKDY